MIREARLGEFDPKARSHIGYAAFLLIGSLAAGGVGVLAGSGQEDTLLWTCVGLLGTVCAFLFVYALRAPWLKSEPFQPAVGLALVAFVGYGVGAIHARYGVVSTAHAPTDALPGLVMGLIAITCFAIGYVAPVGRTIDGARLERWWPAWNPPRAFLAGLILIGVGAVASAYYFTQGEYFVYSTSSLLEQQYSTIGYFRELLFVGLTICAIAAYGPGGTPAMRRPTVFVATAALAALLPTGIRYYVLYVAAGLLLPRHFFYRRLRLGSILAAMVLVVGIIYPIGEMYRRQYQAQSFGSQSLTVSLSGVVSQVSLLGPDGYVDYAFGPALGRVDLATPAAAIQSVVPTTIPFQYGASFMPVVLIWIPRFVWPDKPFYQYDNELGRAEGLINPTDFRTSVKYSYVGELYLDFGWPGIVAGMILYGLLFRLLYQTTRRRHPIGILIYSLALITIWTVESPLGPELGRLVRDTVTALVVLWICGAIRPLRPVAWAKAAAPSPVRRRNSWVGRSPWVHPSTEMGTSLLAKDLSERSERAPLL